MAAGVKNLNILITGDAKKAQKALGDLEKTAGRSGKNTNKHLGGIKDSLLGIGLAAGGAFAFNEWNEAEKIAKQTEAVLKSTGGAANVTAAEIDDLATSLSEKTAIDDEAIIAGQNWLLTFKNVRNEAGKGNDIFNRTSETMLDLSVAMGTDAKSAANLLGKALNDPVKGITALSRAGVTFTAEQKEQIKTLVESGDLLGAQKIILAELESQVKGSAEAQATAYDKAKVSAGNLAETVGGSLAPAIETTAGVTATGAEAFSEMDGFTQKLILGAAVGGVAWLKYGDSLSGAVDGMRGGVSSMSKMDKAVSGLAAGAAGLALFIEVYDAMADVDIDESGLITDLEQLSKGQADASVIAQTLGTDVEGLGTAFTNASRGPKSFAEGIGYLATNLKGDLGGRAMMDAVDRVETLDRTMASMVESGNIEGARSAYAQLSAELVRQGVAVEDIQELMPGYWEALERSGRSGSAAATAILGTADAIDTQATSGDAANEINREAGERYERIRNRADAAAAAIRGFNDEQFGQMDARLGALNALQSYGDALYQNGITTGDATQKARDNEAALIAYATRAREAAAVEYERTGSMQAAQLVLDEYRLRLVAMQDQAGYTDEQIAFMVERMGFTVTGAFDIDSSGALASLDSVQAKIDKLSLGATLAGLSGPYGGERAAGGPVRSGSTYLVGEEGPELFTASGSGRIIPNGATQSMAGLGRTGGSVAGSSAPIYVTVNVQGSVTTESDLVAAVTAGVAKVSRSRGTVGFPVPFADITR